MPDTLCWALDLRSPLKSPLLNRATEVQSFSDVLRPLANGRVDIGAKTYPTYESEQPDSILRPQKLVQAWKVSDENPAAGCSQGAAPGQAPVVADGVSCPLLRCQDQDRNVNHLQLGGCFLNIFLLRKTGKFSARLALSVNLPDLSGALN